MGGLVAVGRAGAWTITLEETDRDGLCVWLRSPVVYLQLNVDVTALRALSEFLRSPGSAGRWCEVEGCLGGVLVFQFHDGWLFVRLRALADQMFEVRLEGAEGDLIARALEEALAGA